MTTLQLDQRRGTRRWVRGAAAPAGCLALAALSLLGPHQPTYDPWAWVIWGREIVEWNLHTAAGPSWKPLPVLFTTVFALCGNAAAPLLWTLVARAGGLLAVALAFRLARRLGGVAAGVLAAVSLALADAFVSLCLRASSEGLLLALAFWAVELHLDGRDLAALAAACAVGLLRPEAWPLLGLYGLWLVWSRRHTGPPLRTVALVSGLGLLVVGLWLVPEYLGSGQWLRAAARARRVVPGTPAQAAHPFLTVFRASMPLLPWPVYAGALLAPAAACRGWRRERRARATLALLAGATALMVTVATLAEHGFAGEARYILFPAGVLCVPAAVGWSAAAAAVARRLGVPAAVAAAGVAAVLAAPSLLHDVARLQRELGTAAQEQRRWQALPGALARAGGADAIRRCGALITDPYETQAVAWYLHVHEEQVELTPARPGTVIVAPGSTLARAADFAPLARTSAWSIDSTCAAHTH